MVPTTEQHLKEILEASHSTARSSQKTIKFKSVQGQVSSLVSSTTQEMRNKGQDQPIDPCTGCPINPSPAVSGSDANTEERSKLPAIPLPWDQRSAYNPSCCQVSALDPEGIACKLSWKLTYPMTASRDKYYVTTHINPCHEQNI